MTLATTIGRSSDGQRPRDLRTADDRAWPVAARLARLRAAAGRRCDVTVLGAGMAGLVAACELERLGHRVRVLEASDRVGGRVWTWRSGAGDGAAHGELGAMRIPAEHAHTLHYVRELGLGAALRPFRSIVAGDGWLRRGDRSAPWSEAESQIFPLYQLGARARGPLRPLTLRFAGRLKTMLDAVGPRELRERFDGELAELLPVLDDLDLAPLLDPARPRVDLAGLRRTYPELRRRWSPAIDHFLADVALETQDALFTLDGGMDRLPEALAARLAAAPITGAPALALASRPDGAVVHARRRGELHTLQSDWIVCTIPFSVLRRLDLTGLADRTRRAIAGARYCPAMKVLLGCRERFWERGSRPLRGGASLLDGPTRQLYYPAPDPRRAAGVLLASYTIGADARALAELPPEVRLARVVQDVGALHPELVAPGMITDATAIDWQAHPWAAGGCSVPWEPADGRPVELDLRGLPPDGRIVFAGEHCSDHPAWIEGAVTSALAAVETIQAGGLRA